MQEENLEGDSKEEANSTNYAKKEIIPKRYIGVVFGCNHVYALPLIETDNLTEAKEHISEIIDDQIDNYKISNMLYDFPSTFHSDWLNYETLRLYELPKNLWQNLYFLDDHDSCYYLVAIFTMREHTTEMDIIMRNLYVDQGHLHKECERRWKRKSSSSGSDSESDEKSKSRKVKFNDDKQSTKTIPELKMKKVEKSDKKKNK